eukprot:6199293-Pleurochrysis_carterae.AAC.6
MRYLRETSESNRTIELRLRPHSEQKSARQKPSPQQQKRFFNAHDYADMRAMPAAGIASRRLDRGRPGRARLRVRRWRRASRHVAADQTHSPCTSGGRSRSGGGARTGNAEAMATTRVGADARGARWPGTLAQGCVRHHSTKLPVHLLSRHS